MAWARRWRMALPCWLGLLLLLTWWFMARTTAQSATLCVRPDGGGGCYTTIQAAVNVATAGDGVLVAAGTYTESVVITTSLVLTGGWQPIGWTLTETVIQANGAACALYLSDVSGRVSRLTVTGAVDAGLCGENLAGFALDRFIARENQGNGVSITVSGTLTVSRSTFRENLGDGLNLECPDYLPLPISLVISHSQSIGNGHNGFNGGYLSCSYFFENVVARDNAAAGIGGFWLPCPAFQQNRLIGLARVNVVASEFAYNPTGIEGNCGASFLLNGNRIHGNTTGVLLYEAVATSVNNLIVSNQSHAVVLRAGYWSGINDTLAGNGGRSFALYDDIVVPAGKGRQKSACDTSALILTNTIAWSDGPSITWEYDDSCPPYIVPFRVEIAYSLVAGREFLVFEPGVINFVLGPAVLDANPFFVGGGDYHIRPPSPAIDRGTADGAPVVDIEGVERPVDGDGDGVPEVDMGAYESPPGIIWHVFLPQVR